MAVCERYRISHSHFLGGPPVWTDEDQDLALAQELRHQDTCQGCGITSSEDPKRLDVITERCSVCEMVEQERDDIPDTERGVKVRVVPADYALQQRQKSLRDPFTQKGD